MPFNFSGISQAKCRSPYTQHDHKSRTNKYITEKLRRNQIALSRQKASDLQAQHRESSIPLRRLLVCGYGSYLVSNFLICVFLKRTTNISLRTWNGSQPLFHPSGLCTTLKTWYTCVIAKPLVALGASTPTDLLEANNTHTITGNALKLRFGRHCSDEHVIALYRHLLS